MTTDPTPATDSADSPPTLLDGEPRPRAVTFRSVILGLLGVILIAALTPYNDFAMGNTFLIGNFLPIGLVLVLLAIVFLINAPLRKLAPKLAIREGELAVILGMILAGCAVPSSGLMRYLPAGIVGIYSYAAGNPSYATLIDSANIPAWLLPEVDGTNAAQIGDSDVVKYYFMRSPDGAVPWAAWIRPMLSWGVMFALVAGLVITLSIIVRRQWSENERLAFPLAGVYTSLIEAPPPGKMINATFRAPGFWIAASLVFLIHGLNALHAYFPQAPEIPIKFDFNTMLADEPWKYMLGDFKVSQIYFSILGIAFFLQAKVGFSLWFMYALYQVALIIIQTSGGDAISAPMQQDQTFGSLLVMTGVILYIGRAHWWMVIRHMFGARRADETESRYLPYAVAGWLAMLFWLGLVAWLMAAGTTFVGGVVISLTLILLLLMTARVLAETGMIFVQINWLTPRIWQYPMLLPETPIRTTPTTFFIAGWFGQLFHDLRENLAGFFQQGLRVADDTAYERARSWRTGLPFVLAIVLAVTVAYFVSFTSMLKTEYSYASTLSTAAITPINNYAIENAVKNQLLDPANTYQAGPPRENHNSAVHIGIGAGITGLLAILRLTLSWWPLHPIAFVVVYAWATGKAYFSVFLGWLCKVIVVRLGGASLLKSARPVFIGLIVGEAFAAGFWLITSLLLHWGGYDYKSILLMPG